MDVFYWIALVIAILTCSVLYSFLVSYCWKSISRDCDRRHSRSLESNVSDAPCVYIHDCQIALSIKVVDGSMQAMTENTTAVAVGERITNIATRSQIY